MLVGPYRDVLSLPGAVAFSAAGFIARLPLSTYGLGAILLVASTTGRYGLAGAVAAVIGVSQALVSPFSSRLVDRLGQRRVLFPVTAANALLVVLLVIGARGGGSAPVLLGLGALVGATVMSFGSLVRARWRHLLGSTDRLQTAFAVESVVDELVFIIGPLVIAVVAVRLDPAAGLLLVAAAALLGASWLSRQHATEPPPDAGANVSGGSALRFPAVRVVAAAFLAVGGIFGSVEVNAVAFTDEREVPGAVGLVLGAFAFGSLVSGLAYGARTWGSALRRRFVLSVLALAAGTVPFAVVGTVPLLTVSVFVAGLGISPMVISGFGLVEAAMPPARLTEGLTVAGTALGLGAAMGAAAAGPVIDTYDASTAFLVTCGFGAVAAVTVALAGRALVRQEAPA